MDKATQIKHRNEIISDIQNKDFVLDMGDYAYQKGDKHRENIWAMHLAERNLCDTPMCIAGDAARRLCIKHPIAAMEYARGRTSASFYMSAAECYITTRLADFLISWAGQVNFMTDICLVMLRNKKPLP